MSASGEFVDLPGKDLVLSENSVDLGNLKFGRLDAESDIQITNYFLKTKIIRDVVSRQKYIVVGRKGAGKTALFRYLEDNLENEVVNLDLDGYPFLMHRNLIEDGLPRSRAYALSWKLLIYSNMYASMRHVLTSGQRKEVDRLLASIGAGSGGAGFMKMFEWMKRIKSVELPTVVGIGGGGIEVGGVAGSLSTASIAAIQEIEKIVSSEFSRAPVTVLIDRLDDGWDGSQESLDLIGGAIRATREIFLTFGQPVVTPVISFLRTDLWERLTDNDMNKTSQDTVYLEWSNDQLSEVVALRIANSVKCSEEDAWSIAFTTLEMRNRTSAQNYMTKRTMGRPRDILAFCIFAEEARDDADLPISSNDIYDAESGYSRHVVNELRDEIGNHVSDFVAVVNSLKALRKRSFSDVDWHQATANNSISAADASIALKQLMEASAIGIFRTGGAAGGSSTVYKYQDRFLALQPDSKYQIHLGLVKELGIKDK